MKKLKNRKAWVAIDRETNEMFGCTHKEGYKKLYLHPTKKDADIAGYGKEYWEIVPVTITFNSPQ